jgi:fatty acid omega-hydroxylase
MLPSLVININHVYDWITELLQESGGTFVFRGPWMSKMQSVITCDPANIEYALKTNFPNYPKGIDFQNVFRDLLGDGIFNADSESWRLQRKIANLEFNSRSFREFTANRVQDMVEKRLVPLLGDAADRGAVIDLQDIFLRYTFDNTCSLVFGRNPGCLAVDLPVIPFAKAFDDAVEATLYRHVMPRSCWKLFRLLKVGKERQFHRALKPLKEFVDDLIAYKKSAIANAGESMSESMSKDLLTSFICKLSDDNDSISYSDKFLRDAVMNFVIAGRDTSGVALTWFFWLLSKNPLVEENIVKEISHILLKRTRCSESHEDCLDMEKALTEKELQECLYLHATLSETLRLYPSVPLDHKGVLKKDVLPDGTCIKPGMRFFYSIYSLGRMESIWGADCLQFKPERWISMTDDGQVRLNQESAYKFAAFNGGPRVCLGKNMAYMQMKAAAAGILRRFQIRVVENHLVVPKISLILSMKHGLMVTLGRRPSTLPLKPDL